MPLNPQQQQVVDALDCSVNVIAGAGTGKTFTLTRRIVAAVERSLENDPDDPDPTSHVLAITFTRKAAAELKSRARQAFLEKASEGGRMSEAYMRCALEVDGAWISTIHGMASRILRENAIEFGIDPSFKTLSTQAASELFSKALQLAVDEAMESDDDGVVDLVEGRDVEGAAHASNSLAAMVETLLDATSYMPDGIDSVVVRRPACSYREAVAPFLKQASLVRRLFDEDGWPDGEAAKLPEIAERMDSAAASLEEWLSAYDDALDTDGEPPDLDGLFESALSFPSTTPKFGKKSDHYEAMMAYRLQYKLLAERLAMFSASGRAASLVRFARSVKRHLDALKRAGQTKFTEGDLLVACNDRLSDPAYSRILERYRAQFQCIMLDEFQDTDPLQMAIVSKLAAQPDDGMGTPTLSNVCTVGDMQQSIYRFRGGDVEETLKRIASIEEGRGKQFQLTGNYRSHKDVLDAVEAVFSQPGVFGDEFLRLDACRGEATGANVAFDGIPRVQFEFVHGKRAARGVPGVASAEVRAVCAAEVARHFRRLADAGARPSHMALLLGRMTYADAYADALRDAGFECAITGGSVFADTVQAGLVDMLLKHATNRYDDAPLLNVLTSPLFQVSDDALLALCRKRTADGVASMQLSRSFASFEGSDQLSDAENESVAVAKKLLSDFVREARRGAPSQALRRLFVRSGYLLALEEGADAQAMSDAGNVAKALRMVADLEAQSGGVATTSSRFASMLQNSKEAPGTLATKGTKYVQIMTVHSSKGLEFDHVALAEMRDGTMPPNKPPLISENIDGCTYVSLRPSKDAFDDAWEYEAYKTVTAFTFEDMGLDPFGEPIDDGTPPGESKRAYQVRQKRRIAEADTPELAHRLLEAYEKMQELEEARRLMYVAMTRARESLFVAFGATTKPSTGYKGVFADAYRAFADMLGEPDGGFEDEFGAASGPIGMKRMLLSTQQDVEAYFEEVPWARDGRDPSDDEAEPVATVPVYAGEEHREVRPYSHSRRGLRSYTSLSNAAASPTGAAADGSAPKSWEYGHESVVDDGFFLAVSALSERSRDEESATDLGSAFHALCQISIIEAQAQGLKQLPFPSDDAIESQAKAHSLSRSQKERLRRALTLWFGSDLASSFAACERIAAEVPFSAAVPLPGGGSFVLEGEIDGLADAGNGTAMLIDYKTGQNAGVSREAHADKHRLQSQCYAYALLQSGYCKVEANFVRVEEEELPQGTADIGECGGAPQPVVVKYSYSLDDVSGLVDDLAQAYGYSVS